MSDDVIHLVLPGAVHREAGRIGRTLLSRCGVRVDFNHGLRLEPTCEACRRLQREDEAAIEELLNGEPAF